MMLRHYQQETLDKVAEGWEEFDKQLVVSPTGSGKTILFSHIAKNALPGRTLIIAHRDELLTQAIDKIQKSVGLTADLEKADAHASLESDIVVASIQTLARRWERWPQTHFDLVVVDEAHHTLSESYLNVLAHFDQHAYVLGVTATPDRGDKKNLGKYYQTVAHEVSMFDLIHQGYLAPISLKCIPIEINLHGVRTSHGDYREDDLAHAIEPYLDVIVQSIIEEAPFRRILIFLPLIATSQKMCRLLNRHGVEARHIDGTSTDRAEILGDFERGKVDVVTNAALLFEGYDNSQIDCVIMLRPTQSRPLFAQAIGRGTRPAPFKKDLLLLDYLWLTDDHKLVCPANLVARDDADAEAMTQKAASSGELLDLEDLAASVVEEREASLRRRLEEKAKKHAKTLDADEFAVMFGAHDAVGFQAIMSWESKPISEKQSAVLVRNGIDLETVRGRGHASKLLDVIFKRYEQKLATPKQVLLLKKYSVKDADKISFEAAKNLIDHYLGHQRKLYQESYS